MGGERLGAKGNFHVLVSFMKRKKPRQDVGIEDRLVVEIDQVAFGHSNGDIIFWLIWGRWWTICTREIHPDALHVGLTQTDHHEAGEEEKHDVNQGDDFDTRFFVRNWRSHSHGLRPVNTALRSS